MIQGPLRKHQRKRDLKLLNFRTCQSAFHLFYKYTVPDEYVHNVVVVVVVFLILKCKSAAAMTNKNNFLGRKVFLL